MRKIERESEKLLHCAFAFGDRKGTIKTNQKLNIHQNKVLLSKPDVEILIILPLFTFYIPTNDKRKGKIDGRDGGEN